MDIAHLHKDRNDPSEAYVCFQKTLDGYKTLVQKGQASPIWCQGLATALIVFLHPMFDQKNFPRLRDSLIDSALTVAVEQKFSKATFNKLLDAMHRESHRLNEDQMIEATGSAMKRPFKITDWAAFWREIEPGSIQSIPRSSRLFDRGSGPWGRR